CREDMIIAPQVVEEARRRMRAGKKTRLSFSSFKHLAIVLEEEDDLEGALEVCESAISVGLQGYDERAGELRTRLARRKKKKSEDSREGFRKSGSSVGKLKALPKEEPPHGLAGSSSEERRRAATSEPSLEGLDDDDA